MTTPMSVLSGVDLTTLKNSAYHTERHTEIETQRDKKTKRDRNKKQRERIKERQSKTDTQRERERETVRKGVGSPTPVPFDSTPTGVTGPRPTPVASFVSCRTLRSLPPPAKKSPWWERSESDSVRPRNRTGRTGSVRRGGSGRFPVTTEGARVASAGGGVGSGERTRGPGPGPVEVRKGTHRGVGERGGPREEPESGLGSERREGSTVESLPGSQRVRGLISGLGPDSGEEVRNSQGVGQTTRRTHGEGRVVDEAGRGLRGGDPRTRGPEVTVEGLLRWVDHFPRKMKY